MNDHALKASNYTQAALQTAVRRMYTLGKPIGDEEIAALSKTYCVSVDFVTETIVDVGAWFASLHAR